MMHFAELADRCASFTLSTLETARERTVGALDRTGGATTHVRTLQMLQLQKAIVAVGMFALFEAKLQDGLNCADGFREATAILDREGRPDLRERLNDVCLAINVLKHGRGRSYDALVAKGATLPFRIKLPGEPFFSEGDVSEASTLVEVDDAFVLACADVIRDVSAAIEGSGRYFI